MPLSYTQDHVGLMARSVEDIALALSITAGYDPADPSSSRAPVPDYLDAITRRRAPRIGLLREFFFEGAAEEVARITSGAVDRLAHAGAVIEEAKLPPSFPVAYPAAYLISRSDTASIHAERFAQKADLYRPAIRAGIEMGMLIPGELYVRSPDPSPVPARARSAPRTLRRAPDTDDAHAGARRHGHRRSEVPGPVVPQRPAVDHGAVRALGVGASARDPARQRHVHRSAPAVRRRLVRRRPRPRRARQRGQTLSLTPRRCP
jgi:hypothetical protein